MPTPSTLSASLVERAISRAFALDPELAEAVCELSGRRIAVQVDGLGLDLVLFIRDRDVRVLSRAAVDASSTVAPPDLTVSGAPFSLLRALADGSTVLEGVTVSGDVSLAQRLQIAARRASFDWEELLARRVGDVAGHEIGRAIRLATTHAVRVGDTFARNAGEYLREEARVTLTSREVGDFAAAVDRIRDDVERLEARILRLERSRGSEVGG